VVVVIQVGVVVERVPAVHRRLFFVPIVPMFVPVSVVPVPMLISAFDTPFEREGREGRIEAPAARA
jgi:hypothetical protein